MTHRCHARNCTVPVKPELLMCGAHWAMVPRSIQRDVWKHYRAGQCDDKQVTRDWLHAADAAIGFVAMREGHGLRQEEIRELTARGFGVSVRRHLAKLEEDVSKLDGSIMTGDEVAAALTKYNTIAGPIHDTYEEIKDNPIVEDFNSAWSEAYPTVPEGPKVLVCGGRAYNNRAQLYATLDDLHKKKPISLIIQGGADGADRLAFEWAAERNVLCLTVNAEWRVDGVLDKAAGRRRNALMLDELEVGLDRVVAFPGGPGTAHMIGLAKQAGVDVMLVGEAITLTSMIPSAVGDDELKPLPLHLRRFVVHHKQSAHDVYIGRPSKWGNPFHKEAQGSFKVSSKDEAIRKYEQWLRSKPERIEAVKQELRGKVLGCWCAPDRCHGEVLARIANEDRPKLTVIQGGGQTTDEPPAPLSLVRPPSTDLVKPLAQRPPPKGRMTCEDAKALGAMCDLCPLSKGKIAPLIVPPTRVDKPKFVIIGEGPGRVEEMYGKPFIGPTGQFVTKLLREAGLKREDGFLTNSALCRGETDKEKQAAAECCAPRLLRELESISPTVPILVGGKPALKQVLGIAKIFFARGFYWKTPEIDPGVVRSARKKADKTRHPNLERRALILEGRAKIANRTVLPTVHPAFVLRSDAWHPIIQQDFKRFGRIVRGELTEANLADNRPFKLFSTPAKIERFFARMGKEISCDIETDGVDPMLAPILCVGVSDGINTMVISPWKRELHAPLLTKHFKGRTIVFHNGLNFDVIDLMAKDGVQIKVPRTVVSPTGELKIIPGQVEDTLIGHHVIGSHFPQRLDHCVSTFLDASPWKIKAGRKGAEEKGILPVKMKPRERALYNAKDAILTILLWRALRADLQKHEALYRRDMALAAITMEMIINGIGADVTLREKLSKEMKHRQDAIKGLMRKLVGDPNFNPSRDSDVREALFKKFNAPVISLTKTGKLSTSSTTLEVYKGNGTPAGRFCNLELDWREVRKSRTTYIEARELAIHHVEGLGNRVRFNWKVYATPSGRWGSRAQSMPKASFVTRCRKCDAWAVLAQVCERCRNVQSEKKGEQRRPVLATRIREIYVARPGCELVYFDLSQAEAHVAAFISQDPEFIATCLGGDVHTGNACAIFPEHEAVIRGDTKGAGKPFRDIAKNFMFGIIYGAAADTIHKFLLGKGFKVKLREVEHLLNKLRKKYKVYFGYAERNVKICQRFGYLVSPIQQRRRFFGFHPKAEEIYNHPEQSGVADIMNDRILRIRPQLPKRSIIVGQFHDALAIEAPKDGESDEVERIVKKVMSERVVIPKGMICESEVSYHQPIDLKRAERLSALG